MLTGVTRSLLALVVVAASLPAQQDLTERRYDVGKRLRRFERAWATAPAGADAERSAASAAMQRAVASFFSMNFAAAAAALDEGTLALGLPAGATPSASARAIAALGVRPARRICAPDQDLTLHIATAYGDPIEATVHVLVSTGRSGPVAEVSGVPPLDVLLHAVDLGGEGDERILVRAGTDADRLEVIADLAVGVIGDARARIAAIEDGPAGAGDETRLEVESSRHLARLLGSLERGGALETDVPAHHLLVEAEAAARAAQSGEVFYGDARSGEFWLRVPVGRRPIPVRMFVPRTDEDRTGPRPLVLALHGAGGSENLFFDGYGDGLVVGLARQRDFYVCAPRAMPDGSAEALVDALAARFAIDRSRVYCVGHSMGAMTAVAAAQRFPKLFAKVAPLGGGGAVRDGAALAAVPFFVAAGENDFALAGARGLARALERDEVPVELRVYPDIEHMLIVQVALPDVFAFFEK